MTDEEKHQRGLLREALLAARMRVNVLRAGVAGRLSDPEPENLVRDTKDLLAFAVSELVPALNALERAEADYAPMRKYRVRVVSRIRRRSVSQKPSVN